MKGCIASVYLVAAAIALMVLLSGCSAGLVPSMRYCDKVEYVRDGSRIVVKAECRAPIGGVLGGA